MIYSAHEYPIDNEKQYLNDAVLDLKHGIETYIYNKKILEQLKNIFNDLIIEERDFYWKVKSETAEKQKAKKGRPRKIGGNI